MICEGCTPRDIVSKSTIPACATDFQCDTWQFISGGAKDFKLWSAARRLQGHNDRHEFSAVLSFNNCADHRRLLLYAIKRREPARLYLQTVSSTEYQRKVWSAHSIANYANTFPGLRSEMEA